MWVFSLELPISVFEEKVDSMSVDASKTYRHFDYVMLEEEHGTCQTVPEVASEESEK